MKKIFNINFMKYFKFFLILIIFSFLTNGAYANCDAGVNFGDDLIKVHKKRLIVVFFSLIFFLIHLINLILLGLKAIPRSKRGLLNMVILYIYRCNQGRIQQQIQDQFQTLCN